MLEPGHNVDISQSANFGILVPLFDKKDHRPNVWTDEFEDEFVRRLEEHEYNPAVDYFLIAGHMVPLITCMANIIREWGEDCENVKVLLWDGKRSEYVVRNL